MPLAKKTASNQLTRSTGQSSPQVPPPPGSVKYVQIPHEDGQPFHGKVDGFRVGLSEETLVSKDKELVSS